MATTDSRVNQASQDLVAILDGKTFQPLFAAANPMRVTVRETSRLTQFKVEDGTTRTDHRVIDPIEIELPLLIAGQFRQVFEALRTAFLAGKELVVQTKARTYSGMMITELPHEEAPDQGDSLPVAVRLQEIRSVSPEFGTLPASKVANPNQASTIDKGNQQTAVSDASTQRRASTLYEILGGP